ncbi:MAG: LPS export ABC transporter permease LptF [Candidatus Rokubacteria bacterium]|nr:LPS export ABC transporter permease LptF [Candidatus Rokubacteria bacterium]
MRILDRYVWKELVVPFLLGLFVFTFLLLLDKIFDLTDLIINKGVPVHLVLLLLAYLLPAFLVLTIPIGFLLAILVAFGRFSADMEIVALKASGVSSLRLLRPVLAFGVATALVTGVLMMEAVPRANYAFKSLIFDILRTQASVGLKERVFNDTFGHFVIYVEEMAPDQVALRNVFVADERNPDELRVVTAREGHLLSDEVNRRITLRLLNGTVHETVPRTFQKYRQVMFRLYDLTLTLENPLVRAGEAPKGDREMTLAELRENAAQAVQAGGTSNPYWVEIHKKYAIPTACLVFAVVGVPLGIRAHRGGRWAAFVILLPIVLFYYVFLTVGEQLGDAGRIPPWLAMWGPNLLVAALGLYLLWAHVTERPLPFTQALQHVASAVARGARRFRVRRPRPLAGGARRPIRRVRRIARSNHLHIVDRYLSREFLTLFAYGLALATVVVIVGDLMTTLDRYIRLKPPVWLILEHFLYRTPPFVYQGLHIVVLMATILLFLNLSRNNELTALKAGGISLYRVSLPIFGLAALVTVGAFSFQEIVLPVLNQKGVEVDEIKIKRRTLPHLQKRTQIWYRGREGAGRESRIYHIDLLDPANREMSDISILDLDADFGIRRRWDARRMRWRELDHSWELRDGMLREFEPGRPDRTQPFRELAVRLPEEFEDFAQIPKAPDVMNYVELRGYIQRLQEAGHKVGKYLVDLYSKTAYPFAHLIMALVGIPFALRSPRGGRLIGVALCLALGLAYFVVHSAAVALARTEILPPLVAAWAANVLFATLGLFLFLRAQT